MAALLRLDEASLHIHIANEHIHIASERFLRKITPCQFGQ